MVQNFGTRDRPAHSDNRLRRFRPERPESAADPDRISASVAKGRTRITTPWVPPNVLVATQEVDFTLHAGSKWGSGQGYLLRAICLRIRPDSPGRAATFKGQALGRGYVEKFPGSRGVRDTEHRVDIDVVLTGGFPGNGKPKPVAFPIRRRRPSAVRAWPCCRYRRWLDSSSPPA